MLNLNRAVLDVIEIHFNDEMLGRLNKIKETNDDKYILNYSALAIALGVQDEAEDVIELENFYMTDIIHLSKVDKYVMSIIKELQKYSKDNIKELYKEAATFDINQPELGFLANEVIKYLG